MPYFMESTDFPLLEEGAGDEKNGARVERRVGRREPQVADGDESTLAERALQVEVPQVGEDPGGEAREGRERADAERLHTGNHVTGQVAEHEEEERGGGADGDGEEGGEGDDEGGQDDALEEGEEEAAQDDAAFGADEGVPGGGEDGGEGARVGLGAAEEEGVVDGEAGPGHPPEREEEDGGEHEEAGDEGEDEAGELAEEEVAAAEGLGEEVRRERAVRSSSSWVTTTPERTARMRKPQKERVAMPISRTMFISW
jgi:hypothetical protein